MQNIPFGHSRPCLLFCYLILFIVRSAKEEKPKFRPCLTTGDTDQLTVRSRTYTSTKGHCMMPDHSAQFLISP